jgi:ATP-dependent helicase HrpA
LASGRELDTIRSELGQQAAESISQVDDPRWNRDGLTDWDFDELPAEIDLPRGRLSVKAYPALIDRDGAVSLRLVDSPQRAELETRFGLRRLCLLAARREMKTQVDWLPNLDKMELYTATPAGFDLRRQLAELLADRAMVADQPVPRTKDDFQRLLAAGRQRIAWAAQELTAVAWPIFEGYHQANLALDEFCSRAPHKPAGAAAVSSSSARHARPTLLGKPVVPPTKTIEEDPAPRWQYATDDMREQIVRLMEPQTFSKTPWEWLRQYPRYFRAVCSRLQNLPGGVARDWEKFQEFQPRWQLFLERARHQQAQGIVDAELLHLRWMLEEYRVSLFAQKLGTAIPVSPKRLEQQWAKAQV